jgi:hypothetical protein
MLSHFSGVVLGRTTVDELKQLGDRTSTISMDTGEPFQCYYVGPNRLACWYHGNICDHAFLSKSEGMPDEWTQAGFDWRLSYNEWLQLLEKLGFAVETKEPPHAVSYQDRECLGARIAGTRIEDVGTVEFEFAFNYGEKGAGVDDKATLYSITPKWLRPAATVKAVAASPSESSSTAVTGESSPVFSARTTDESGETGAAGTPMLSHFSGVILGRTTVSELNELGDRTASIDERTGEPFQCYEVGPNGLACWYKGNVCDHAYLTKTGPMPKEWAKAGFDWRLSYNEWLQLFEELGFAVEIKDPPRTGSFQFCTMVDITRLSAKDSPPAGTYETRDCLAAEVVGTKTEDVGRVAFLLDFNYGEKGAGVDDKATLYSITAKWLGK